MFIVREHRNIMNAQKRNIINVREIHLILHNPREKGLKTNNLHNIIYHDINTPL